MEEDLLFEIRRDETYVQVKKTDKGYCIISFMANREPQLERTDYEDSEKYNSTTEWTSKKLTIHAMEEDYGLITPIERR